MSDPADFTAILAHWEATQPDAVAISFGGTHPEFRKVTPGPRVGRLQVITAGLQPGDRVVVEGLQKLQNNAPVAPTFQPIADEAAPAPGT